jgi:hypothetical protein
MLVQASQPYGRLADLTTDGVAACERFDYWRNVVLRRTRPELPERDSQFRARLRRIVLAEVELIEHASDAVISGRSPGRTRFDGGDDIALELIRSGTSNLTHNGQHRLKPGDLTLVDYERPFQTLLTRHRACGVVLSRRQVREVLRHGSPRGSSDVDGGRWLKGGCPDLARYPGNRRKKLNFQRLGVQTAG